MPSCLCVCVSTCRQKKFKNASSGLVRAFADIILNTKNEHNNIRMFLYLIQVKAVLFVVISATSYYRFLGYAHFVIAHGTIDRTSTAWHCTEAQHKVHGVSTP